MMTRLASIAGVAALALALQTEQLRPSPQPRTPSPEARAMPDVRLMTVDPGHFHAALVQKEMYPGVDPKVDVYAPPGADLDAHLKRIDAFNKRAAQPTTWNMALHT